MKALKAMGCWVSLESQAEMGSSTSISLHSWADDSKQPRAGFAIKLNKGMGNTSIKCHWCWTGRAGIRKQDMAWLALPGHCLGCALSLGQALLFPCSTATASHSPAERVLQEFPACEAVIVKINTHLASPSNISQAWGSAVGMHLPQPWNRRQHEWRIGALSRQTPEDFTGAGLVWLSLHGAVALPCLGQHSARSQLPLFLKISHNQQLGELGLL